MDESIFSIITTDNLRGEDTDFIYELGNLVILINLYKNLQYILLLGIFMYCHAFYLEI